MRFSRIRSAVAAAALLAALPAHGQNAMQTPPVQNPPGAVLTPPGSTTGVPLLPAPTGGGQATPPLPGVTFPAMGLPTMGTGTSPGLGGTTLPGMGGMGSGGSDLSGILSGTPSVPLTRTLGQLNPNWRCMTITGSLDLGTVTQVISSLMGSAGIGVYYTKGQTVSVGDVTYLIAYRTQPQVLNVANLLQMAQSAAATSKPPTPEKLTPQTPLALSLLNLQTIGSLTDIRPFDLSRELADSAAAVRAYHAFLNSMGAMGAPAAPHPAPPRAKSRRYPPT